MRKPLLLLQTGDAPPFVAERCGNFDAMFFRTADLNPLTTHTVRVARGEQLRSPNTYRGAVITGSPAMVTDRAPWSEATAEWLRRAVEARLPLFGVCYGHQLMAHALGGVVGYLDGGEEVGTLPVTLTAAGGDHPLLRGLPATFPANLAHSQTVLQPPAGAVVLAASERDSHQMLDYGDNALSVQFHPEFDGTATKAYLDLLLGENPGRAEYYDWLKRDADDTPAALEIMRRFIASLNVAE